jgi:hypothetical protein
VLPGVISQPGLPQTGVTVVSGVNHIAVGQEITATVEPGPVKVGPITYTWSIPAAGVPICGYSVSAGSATAPTPFVASSNSGTATFYFAYPAGTVTISCVAHTPSGDVPVSNTVEIDGPSFDGFYACCGNMELLVGSDPDYSAWSASGGAGDPTGFFLYGAPNYASTQTIGVWQYATVEDPSFLTSVGRWGYVQVLHPGSYTVNNGTPYTTWGLDGGFPYDSPPYGTASWEPSDGGTWDVFQDMPGMPGNPVLPHPYNLDWDSTFNLYVFYKPPPNSAGAPSTWIPIALLPWYALGECSSTTADAWTQYDLGSCFSNYPKAYPTFPTWPGQGSF